MVSVIHQFDLANNIKATFESGMLTVILHNRWRKPLSLSFPVPNSPLPVYLLTPSVLRAANGRDGIMVSYDEKFEQDSYRPDARLLQIEICRPSGDLVFDVFGDEKSESNIRIEQCSRVRPYRKF